jgi:NAD(P)-dependent dehydrogenase (short-subunit alcohol dehydrogenase family)
MSGEEFGEEFEGRVAFVTGGTLGIGRAAAERLASGGARVAVVGHGDDVAAAEREFRAAGHDAVAFDADVSRADAVGAAVDAAVERFGRLDVVVCSAGIQTYGRVDELPEEVWDRTMDVNVKGMFLTARATIPHLRASGGGVIVNVASVQADAHQQTVPAYCASKGAIRALTRAMALDHALEGIRVVSVSPGAIDTPMLRHAATDFSADGNPEPVIEAWGRSQPIGRVGRAEEVAELIAFLASDRAAFITGSDHLVDGGVLAALGGVELPQ